jgi:trehalose 6-phosphate synthase
LDYTKGIPERIEAVGRALERYPDLQGKMTLVQLVVPSREEVPEYAALKARIEQMASEVNGRFTRPGWVPIHHLYRRVSRDELVAYYRAAEVCMVTSLRDGMNLVAKEYCACNLTESGVLILSEFTGAAAELQKGVLLVNPYDMDGMADAIYKALTMSPDEKKRRMKSLRKVIRRRDIFWWVDSFLRAAFSKELGDFPVLPEIPTPEIEKIGEHGG